MNPETGNLVCSPAASFPFMGASGCKTERAENKTAKSLESEARFPGLSPGFATHLLLTSGLFCHLRMRIMWSPHLGGSCEAAWFIYEKCS